MLWKIICSQNITFLVRKLWIIICKIFQTAPSTNIILTDCPNVMDTCLPFIVHCKNIMVMNCPHITRRACIQYLNKGTYTYRRSPQLDCLFVFFLNVTRIFSIFLNSCYLLTLLVMPLAVLVTLFFPKTQKIENIIVKLSWLF